MDTAIDKQQLRQQILKQYQDNINLVTAEIAAAKKKIELKQSGVRMDIPGVEKVTKQHEAKAWSEALLNKGYSNEQLVKLFKEKYPDLWEQRSGVPGIIKQPATTGAAFVSENAKRVGNMLNWLGGGKMNENEASVLMEDIDKALSAGEIKPQDAEMAKKVIQQKVSGNLLTKAGEAIKGASGVVEEEMEFSGMDTEGTAAGVGRLAAAIYQSMLAGGAVSGAIGAPATLAGKIGVGMAEGASGAAVESVGRTGELSPLEVGVGATLGGAMPVAGAILKPTGKAIKESIIEPAIVKGAQKLKPLQEADSIFSGIVDKIDNVATKIKIRQAEAATEKALTKAISPKLQKGGIDKYLQKGRDAADDIVRNKNILQFTDDGGDIVTGRVPHSLKETSEAIGQLEKDLLTKTDDALKAASGRGATISTADDVASLLQQAEKAGINPAKRKYLQTMAQRLQELDGAGVGAVDDFIKDLNATELSGYYNRFMQSTNDKIKGDVAAEVAKNMRTKLNNAVSQLGDEFKDLKMRYGNLQNLKYDVGRKIWNQAKKADKGLIDYSDMISFGDMAMGLASGDVSRVLRGAAIRATKEYMKKLNSPDRLIRNMFQSIDDANTALLGTTSKNIKRLAERVKAGSGFTVDHNGVPVEKGIATSLLGKDDEIVLQIDNNFDNMFMKKFEKFKNRYGEKASWGGWQEDGKLIQDIVSVTDDPKQAIYDAIINRQDAIGDLAKYSSGADGTIYITKDIIDSIEPITTGSLKKGKGGFTNWQEVKNYYTKLGKENTQDISGYFSGNIKKPITPRVPPNLANVLVPSGASFIDE